MSKRKADGWRVWNKPVKDGDKWVVIESDTRGGDDIRHEYATEAEAAQAFRDVPLQAILAKLG